MLTGPMFSQTDLRFSKRTKIVGRTDIEFAVEMLNVFNQANFVPVGIGSSSQAATAGQHDRAVRSDDADGHEHSRLIQFVARINW